jgi:hypothetical protein
MSVQPVERTIQLRKRVGWLVSFCLVAVFIAQPVFADDYFPEEWQFTVAPYLWALQLDGDVTIDGHKAKVDMGFDDILNDLNVAFMIDIEARKDRWGFFINPLYSQTENSSKTSFLQDTLYLGQTYKINTEIDLFIVSVGSYYRLGPWKLDSSEGESGPQLIVDVMAGARYTHLNVDIDLDRKSGLPLPGLPAHISDEGNVDWVDPIVGARTTFVLSPAWMVSLFGDVGGFGVGSDRAWMATGGVGYNFKAFGDMDSQLYVGYRGMNQDYSEGSGSNKFEWDVTLHGPVFSLGVYF